MADNSIARVYQFLSNNYSSINEWKKEVDERYGNGDGTVLKSEFGSFMLREFDFEDGDNQNDIINKFWASIDTKVTGKVGSTGVANVNALDANELAKAELMLQASNKISEFLRTKSSEYQNLGISDIERWKNSVKQGMMDKLSSSIQESDLNDESKLQTLLERAYQQTVRKATADCVADDVIQTEISNNQDFSGITYQSGSDDELRKIKERYIKSLDSDEQTPLSQIVSDVTTLVQAYADTAKTNSQSSIDTLGSSYNANGKLNDLQMAVLSKQISDAIKSKLTSDSKYKAMYEALGDKFDAKIQDYLKNELVNKKASEFTNIKNSISSFVDKFFSTEISEIEKEYDDFQTAKSDLIDLVKAQLSATTNATERRNAVKEVFGSNDLQTVTNTINNAIKTINELNSKKSELATKLSSIDAKAASSVLEKIPGTISVMQSGSFSAIALDSALTYKSSNSECPISISSGSFTVNTANNGNWTTTIEVYNAAGEQIGSKNISVKVLKKLDFATTQGELDGHSFTSIMTTSSIGLILNTMTSEGGLSGVLSTAKSNLKTYIASIKSALAGKVDDTERLDRAEQNTYNYFSAAMDSIVNNHFYDHYSTTNMNQNRDVRFTYLYVDANNETQTGSASGKFLNNVHSDDYDVDKHINTNVNTTGIALNCGYDDGADRVQFTINSQVLLKKFMSFYNA